MKLALNVFCEYLPFHRDEYSRTCDFLCARRVESFQKRYLEFPEGERGCFPGFYGGFHNLGTVLNEMN
jgi:hypothetical protein